MAESCTPTTPGNSKTGGGTIELCVLRAAKKFPTLLTAVPILKAIGSAPAILVNLNAI
jgi:hypothetical protein